MRTTLTIDDDLAGLLKRRARELRVPFKDVVAGRGITPRESRRTA
jgi:hypothetical protein